MIVQLEGIIFKDKLEYKFVKDIDFHIVFENKIDINLDSILFVNLTNIYQLEFLTFPNIDEFVKLVNEINESKSVKKIIYILNEICINNLHEFDIIKEKTNINYKILNYDLFFKNKNHIFYPSAVYSHLKYLIDNDYLNGKNFLINMNKQFHNLRKPYKAAFYSRHINPIRIDIFNILKNTNSLNDITWSFFNLEESYSRDRHDLDNFLEENKGIIPFSYDSSDTSMIFKHTYFSQFLCYFEILTESYFIKDIKNKQEYCPMTEKIVKPILSLLPFIIFGPSELKKGLEEIGLTFKSPLYGFYDISDNNQVELGLKHVETQIKMSKSQIHETYFEYLKEYTDNLNIFLDYFRYNLKDIENEFNT
jgi:hypothetical protein